MQRQPERASNDDRHPSQSSHTPTLDRRQACYRQHAETAQGRRRREKLYPFIVTYPQYVGRLL